MFAAVLLPLKFGKLRLDAKSFPDRLGQGFGLLFVEAFQLCCELHCRAVQQIGAVSFGKLELLLFPLQVITLAIWTGQRGAVARREGAAWLVLGLALIMSALVGLLGKLGGQLSFPARK